ncbi:MAG TPA: lipase maturation factor family protein [Chthoniobacterales bacterium]|nr:lipase maturation factor family protein [Chthoniobacterales bacterium]
MKPRPGSTLHVSNPPPKPLMVYDGDCGFCKLWVARWEEETGAAVEYQPLQEAAARFPEVGREDFERAVKLIEPDGQVWTGAAAVYRSLGAGGRPLNRWSYDHVPGFATASEMAYRFIAGHRELAHRVTLLLWGNDVRRPAYFQARRWFLRALGAIYLIAFLSFWVQADGLVGAQGILPLPQFLEAAQAELGSRAWHVLPTLCWFNSSNAFLHFLCGAGAVFSVLLICGITPIVCLVLLGALYLSITIAGQTFFSFQWDILLLETGFLAIFLAPWQWWLRRGRTAPLSRPALFLLQFLLFKLMFMSGVVKLTSGDPSWWNLSALDYHYWTQPLPTVLGWWADKSPEWFKHFSTEATLVIEIVLPFFIWFPRRLRLLACGLFVVFQIAIGLTGNYAFFNLLTIALCLLLIDDEVWPEHPGLTIGAQSGRWPVWVPALVILATMPLNAILIFNGFRPQAPWPPLIESVYDAVAPFRILNSYGLFRVMTKERREIILEGSADGIEWKAYEFKWKPGALDRRPAFVEPHQPRLDWQMWFAALSDVRQNPWFFGLALRLLENSPDVVALLGKNPFPEKPPRYLRANIYRYHFSNLRERESGIWWRREDERTYLPVVSRGRE